MRTTCTMIGSRVATGGDFLALGEGVRKTPNWNHIVIQWPDDCEPSVNNIELSTIDGQWIDYDAYSGYRLEQILRFCRQWKNFYKADLETLNAPS